MLDGLEQVGLSQTGVAVNKQGIKHGFIELVTADAVFPADSYAVGVCELV